MVISRPGGYHRLEFESFSVPEPGSGEVLIEVRAIGVNYANIAVRMGLYESAKEFVGWPITPGFEVSGIVSQVGREVSGLRVGDKVFGVTLFGGYTSHIVLPQHQVVSFSGNLSFESVSGFPAVFLTADFAVEYLAHPRSGDLVLVHSAAGGVGGALIQLLKYLGCRVVGVVGASHKVEVARSFGADLVVDKSVEPLWESLEEIGPDGFDVIFDANGVATLSESYCHLRAPGKLVVYGFHTMMPRTGGRANYLKLALPYLRTPRFNPFRMTYENRSVMAFNLSTLFERKDLLDEAMVRLQGGLGSGQLVPLPVTVYPFEEVARAHRDIESAQTVGKLVLVL